MTEVATAGTGTAEETGGHTLTITRLLPAPREVVFRAWTEPEMLVRWWGPQGMTTPLCEMDVRPGGRWRTCMRNKDGKDHYVRGVYREVVAPERLVLGWAWETDGVPGHESVLTIELHDRGGETELVLTHAGLETASARDSHTEGWASSLDCLAGALGQV